LPGKPLADIAGKPMIQRVYEQAIQAKLPDQVIVATDHEEIFKVVTDFGGQVMMTASNHPTGTDRLAEVAAKLPDAQIIVNIQGDEPEIDPDVIDRLIQPLLQDKEIAMATVITPMDESEMEQPGCVKAVVDQKGNALYFSRSLIPYLRTDCRLAPVYKHIGVYGYQKEFLLEFARLSPTPLEQMESLEQLRALEYGYRIKTILVNHAAIGVDTPEDLEAINEKFRKMGEV
jgi:3-deoxy-manno-octulosonate cytidylyltransferase (CMP-KDO synthetase)